MSTTHDFNDGKGPVPACQHINPDGSIGGWVAESAIIDSASFIGEEVEIFGSAKIAHSHIQGKINICDLAGVYYSRIENFSTHPIKIFDDIAISGMRFIDHKRLLRPEPIELWKESQICYGCIGDFNWVAFATEKSILLKFGCEEFRLAFWEEQLDVILKQDPGEREAYRNQLKALFPLIRASVKY